MLDNASLSGVIAGSVRIGGNIVLRGQRSLSDHQAEGRDLGMHGGSRGVIADSGANSDAKVHTRSMA